MDDNLFRIRYIKETMKTQHWCCVYQKKYAPTILYQPHTPLLARHPCVMSMYHMIRKMYYFPIMLPLIKQSVASCYECQSMKDRQPTPKVYYPRIPLDARVMARILIDVKAMPKSVIGYNCILVSVCEYTNWVKQYHL